MLINKLTAEMIKEIKKFSVAGESIKERELVNIIYKYTKDKRIKVSINKDKKEYNIGIRLTNYDFIQLIVIKEYSKKEFKTINLSRSLTIEDLEEEIDSIYRQHYNELEDTTKALLG